MVCIPYLPKAIGGAWCDLFPSLGFTRRMRDRRFGGCSPRGFCPRASAGISGYYRNRVWVYPCMGMHCKYVICGVWRACRGVLLHYDVRVTYGVRVTLYGYTMTCVSCCRITVRHSCHGVRLHCDLYVVMYYYTMTLVSMQRACQLIQCTLRAKAA